MRLLDRFWNKLADWQIRYEVWQFERKSVPVRVYRLCGHVTETRVERRRLADRVAGYRSSPCPECRFKEALERLREQ
jgi:hypothetical protein